MAANVYECMFLLDANKVAGDVPCRPGPVARPSGETPGRDPRQSSLGRTAPGLSGEGHKKGLYYLTYFKIEGKKLVDIEQDVALNETILRSMVLRIDPKLVDTMLAIARDEHATALPSRHDTDGLDGRTMTGRSSRPAG